MDTDHPDMAMLKRHAEHSAQLMRDAIKRELESEMRGLLMAAKMHDFRLEVSAEGVVAIDLRAAP